MRLWWAAGMSDCNEGIKTSPPWTILGANRHWVLMITEQGDGWKSWKAVSFLSENETLMEMKSMCAMLIWLLDVEYNSLNILPQYAAFYLFKCETCIYEIWTCPNGAKPSAGAVINTKLLMFSLKWLWLSWQMMSFIIFLLCDAIWHHNIYSILIQLMAWFLMAPSHYLNQCSQIISEVLWQSLEDNISGRAEGTCIIDMSLKLLIEDYSHISQGTISWHGL